MYKYQELCWNVLLLNNESISFNIFQSVNFHNYLMDLRAREKRGKIENIKEEVRAGLAYSFQGKAEYEINAASFLSSDVKKIDVYEQVYQNFEIFFNYLMSNWSKIPIQTYRQQKNRKR